MDFYFSEKGQKLYAEVVVMTTTAEEREKEKTDYFYSPRGRKLKR